MFTRIVSIVVLIAFALSTAQCAPSFRLSRQQIPIGSTRGSGQKIAAAKLASGEVIKFPGPGAQIDGPPWTLTGRDELGVWHEILLDDLLYVRVVNAGQGDSTIRALLMTGLMLGAVALVVLMKDFSTY